MKIPRGKMPNNVVEHFGNSGGVTIPTLIAFDLRERFLRETMQVCLAGFGSGLTWSAMLLRLGKLDFNTIIDYP
jgi:3-oxoacyl-[acyl-carrier-protein] synthase-3